VLEQGLFKNLSSGGRQLSVYLHSRVLNRELFAKEFVDSPQEEAEEEVRPRIGKKSLNNKFKKSLQGINGWAEIPKLIYQKFIHVCMPKTIIKRYRKLGKIF